MLIIQVQPIRRVAFVDLAVAVVVLRVTALDPARVVDEASAEQTTKAEHEREHAQPTAATTAGHARALTA
jgi:hypothetical protein